MTGILSFTTVFPNPAAPHAGVFVARRLERLAELEKVYVVAPVIWRDYRRGVAEQIPSRRRQGALEVFHPRWVHLPAGGALNALLLFAQSLPAVWRIGRSNIDVIDVHFGHPEAFAAALLSIAIRRPFVVTLRGSEVIHGRYPLRRLFMGWALRRAARVIAVSGRLRDFALSLGVDPLRATTVPNGVDATVFYPRDRAAARERAGIALETKVILTAGNLVEEKGQHCVIQGLASVRRGGVPAELFIAGAPGREGGDEYAARLRAMADALGLAPHVHFLGRVAPAELAEYMCAADVFCLASAREGWPNVVHEALACGTPSVCTDVGAVPDLVVSQQHGYIVPSGDQAALDAALARALSTAWDRPAIAARAGSRTWERVAREVLAELENVVAGREPAQYPVRI